MTQLPTDSPRRVEHEKTPTPGICRHAEATHPPHPFRSCCQQPFACRGKGDGNLYFGRNASQPPCSLAPRLTRRRFLGTAAAAGAATFAAPALVRGRNLNEKLNIAIIGCGGRGASNLADVVGENIVALCDVNAANLARAAEKHPQRPAGRPTSASCTTMPTSSTPWWSAPANTRTPSPRCRRLQLGKHVYCEKPLTHSIWEARVIREAAAKAKVATQMGTQIHAGDNYRRVVELVQTGAIGPVREVHVWVSRAWGWQSAGRRQAARRHRLRARAGRPSRSRCPRASTGICGSARRRSGRFNNVYFPGPKWYRWWDFGNGTMSDLGSHWIDLPFWALKLQAPLTIEADGPPPHAGDCAGVDAGDLRVRPARRACRRVKLTWYQGANKPAALDARQIPQWDSGVLFIGDKGMLLADYGKHVLLPEEEFAGFTAARAVHSRVARPSCRMDPRLQDRRRRRRATSSTPAG